MPAKNERIRPAVRAIVALGVIPPENEITDEALKILETLFLELTRPATDAEARVLLSIFGGEDDLYEGKWTLVHFVESAPGWPLEDALAEADPQNYWIRGFKRRIENGRLYGLLPPREE